MENKLVDIYKGESIGNSLLSLAKEGEGYLSREERIKLADMACRILENTREKADSIKLKKCVELMSALKNSASNLLANLNVGK